LILLNATAAGAGHSWIGEVHDAGRTGRTQAAASYEPNAAQTHDKG
jgi:hypothetical protein